MKPKQPCPSTSQQTMYCYVTLLAAQPLLSMHARMLSTLPLLLLGLGYVRPNMRYYFRSGCFRPNPGTKHISVPPRHMTKSYIPNFNMISQHYRYKDTHLIQSAYNCLNTIHQRKIHV